MKLFGLFDSQKDKPLYTFEGDGVRLDQRRPFATVLRDAETLTIVHLAPGQYVTEIKKSMYASAPRVS